MLQSLTAPQAEYLSHDGHKSMLFSCDKALAIYAFLEDLQDKFNQLMGETKKGEDPQLSYVDYLIAKLKISQSFLVSGMYLSMHVAPAHVNEFLLRISKETLWRLADAQELSSGSWLKKGGLSTLPDARGMVLRGYSNSAGPDPDGFARPLGTFQDTALKMHAHVSNMSFFGSNVRSSIPLNMYAMKEGAGEGGRCLSTVNTVDTLISAHESRMKNISALTLILS